MRFGIPLTLVSLTINDEQRDREVRDDRATLYTSFRRYVEANPVYVPFPLLRHSPRRCAHL